MKKTDKEVLELCLSWFQDIIERSEKLTSGNVAHGRVAICGAAKSYVGFVTEYLKERWKPNDDKATNEYIDLGLPSGTLWKSTNEEGYYTFDEAVEKFGDNLPNKEQWEELKDKCKWVWKDVGYDVTGPNGKSIFLPAAGYRYGTNTYGFVSMNGYYWSSMYASMYFHDKFHGIRYDGRNYGLSVRLVK